MSDIQGAKTIDAATTLAPEEAIDGTVSGPLADPPIPMGSGALAIAPTALPPTAPRTSRVAERDFRGLFERKLEEITGIALQTKESKAALAKLVTVSKRVFEAESPILYRQAYLATLAFTVDHERSDVTSAIVDDLEFASSRDSPIYTVMRGLCIFIVTFTVLLILLSAAFLFAGRKDLLFWVFQYQMAAAVAGLFGVLGSIVSILLRLPDFANAKRQSRDFLWATGFCLPFVGLVFALVTSALFSSHMINIEMIGASDATDPGFTFYIVIGFLSGFSERFTKRLLGAAESGLAPTHGAPENTVRDQPSRSPIAQRPSS